MRTNRKKNLKLIALILVLLLGIGFAAIATNLKIIGTLNVSRTSWDVHFENVQVAQGSVTANPAPTSDNTTTTEMTYTINFTKPGDFFEFTTDIVNDGTIDAMVDVVSNNAYATAASTTPISLPTYLTSTATYEDGTPILQNQKLDHNTSEKIKVRVEFRQDITAADLPSSGDTSVVFKFVGDYKQADENAISTYEWRLPEGRTKDNLQLGDEICTRDQCFNFIKYDNNDIVMLAKYDLKVGNIYNNTFTKIGEFTSSDPGYGLQSNEVKGYKPGDPYFYGMVKFTETQYWIDDSNPYATSTIKPEYGTTYPVDVYDATNYAGAPGTQTYSVAYYVEQYKNKLTTIYNKTIKTARLLTVSEVKNPSIECYESSGHCPADSFITSASFWLGSSSAMNSVYIIRTDAQFGASGYAYEGQYGVRPVIVVEKSNI